MQEEKYAHRYPYDWRSKQPVIFRATEQWFASVGGFQSEALDAIQQVQWVPPSGVARITAMTAGRSDWCISRQRKWGVPIPVFYDKETGAKLSQHLNLAILGDKICCMQRQKMGWLAAGEALMTQEVIKHIASLVEQKGSDIWWQADTAALLPDSLQSRAATLKKGLDTMDVYAPLHRLTRQGSSTPVKKEAFAIAIARFQNGRRCYDTLLGSAYASCCSG